jgi:hypothetical protein
MKKILPILTGFTFAAGILVGGYIVSIVLDKSLSPRDKFKNKLASIGEAIEAGGDYEELVEEGTQELIDAINEEIDAEVLKELDEKYSG